MKTLMLVSIDLHCEIKRNFASNLKAAVNITYFSRPVHFRFKGCCMVFVNVFQILIEHFVKPDQTSDLGYARFADVPLKRTPGLNGLS